MYKPKGIKPQRLVEMCFEDLKKTQIYINSLQMSLEYLIGKKKKFNENKPPKGVDPLDWKVFVRRLREVINFYSSFQF